jgi:hypothetical protein
VRNIVLPLVSAYILAAVAIGFVWVAGGGWVLLVAVSAALGGFLLGFRLGLQAQEITAEMHPHQQTTNLSPEGSPRSLPLDDRHPSEKKKLKV